MKKWFPVSTFLLMSMGLSACSSFTSPLKKLEGKWTTGGSFDEYHSWYLEYRFRGNNYELVGYPPLSETGRIKLKECHGDSLLVVFEVKKSSPVGGDHEEWIYLSGNTFSMEGNVFTRSNESKLEN
jgi:hypothetical protein